MHLAQTAYAYTLGEVDRWLGLHNHRTLWKWTSFHMDHLKLGSSEPQQISVVGCASVLSISEIQEFYSDAYQKKFFVQRERERCTHPHKVCSPLMTLV